MPKKGASRREQSRGVGTSDKVARPRATRAETTERILDAAAELFAARNPMDVTVREVAERAGVSHALVHQYAGSKDDLLNAVIQRVTTDRAALVKRSPLIREALATIALQVLTNPVHTKTVVRSAMDGVEYHLLKERIETGQSSLALTMQNIASGVQPAPTPRELDVRVIIAAITALAFGWGAIEDWLWPVYELEGLAKEDVHRQVAEIVSYLADLTLVQDPEGNRND